ncbi:MAG: LPS export ABC transporter protein LptC [Bermanella sp.]|jgi:LPS export ABC transporter protein LptC
MNNKTIRTLRTLPLSAAIAGLALLLLSATEYGESGKLGVASRELSSLRQFDSYLLEPSGTTYTKNGAIAYRWQASRANRQYDGQIILISPIYHGQKAEQHSWTAVAQRGILSADGQRLDLDQDVIIKDFVHTAKIESQALTLDIASNQLRTSHPVQFTSPDALTTATGMHAMMDSERIEFLADVKGRYESP